MSMYRVMWTITLTDERAREEVRAGRLKSAFYPVRGLEGSCAGAGAALRRDDQLVSTYRNLGDAVACGMSLRSIVAEIYGRAEGCSGGKGGPMHLHDSARGFMATTGVVGSGLPIASGLALAAQLEASDRVVMVTFGDGATSIGAFHEAANLAALWRLPLIFLCQNNQWAEHTPIADYAGSTRLSDRARSYGLTAERVDGFDPIAVWRSVSQAAERARGGDGPTFLESVSYRLTGHSGSADYSYVPKSELEAAMARDPAPTFRAMLLADGYATPIELEDLEARVRAEVTEAYEFALAGTDPAETEVLADVFAHDSWVRAIND
jgi:pyruvate dehydrogenase E1 component alpha subunit